MADNNIEIKIHLEEGGSTATLKNFKDEVIKSGVSLRDLRGEFGNFIVHSKKMSASVKLTGKELKNLEKTVGGFKTATGGATAAAMELGRVVSDAPYGIRGMANNVSQLASQITYMANATDKATGKSVGFVGAIKGVGRSLMGTTGVLLAIQAVIAAVDYFANRTDNATDSASDFEEGINGLVSVLDDLAISQDKANEKILEYIQYRAFAAKSDKELKELLEDMSDLEDDINSKRKKNADFELLFKEKTKGLTIEQYKALSELEKKEVRRSAQITNITDRIKDYERRVESVIKLEDERVKAIKRAVGIRQSQIDNEDNFKKAEEGTLKSLKNKLKELKKDREVLSKTSEDYKKLTVEINNTQKAIDEIQGKSKKVFNNKKISIFKTKEELDLDVKNQEQALLRLQDKLKIQNLKNSEAEELANASTEEDKKRIKERYSKVYLEMELSNEKKRLELAKSTEKNIARAKHNEHVANLMRILEEYKLKIKLDKSISEAKKKELTGDAESKTRESILQSGKELSDTISQIDEAYEPLFSLYESLGKARRDALGIGDGEKKQGEFDALSSYIESYKVLMSGVTDFVNGESERQLQIEQNKTNALNEELNNRLLNENLSVNERKRIQNEIARNDEEARKKRNEIKKKAFNTQKAFNISMAIADTYLAGVKVLADPFFVGRPWERGIAMGATIASGLASVAAIARQKFQPEAASTPIRTSGGAGGGGGVGNRTFDFNLVGSSQGNQVAEAVQGQFDKPIKAYVVSKDITNQQQLDANTKSSAKFGG